METVETVYSELKEEMERVIVRTISLPPHPVEGIVLVRALVMEGAEDVTSDSVSKSEVACETSREISSV